MPLSPLPVFVVSAPSGTGKTTLNRRLVAEHPEVQISVSYTTRARRPSEIEGVHYHYVANERFRELIAQGEMLEYAEVFGTLYGTSKTEIDRLLGAHKIPLLEIDVQGWRSAMPKLPSARSVFILPPSIEELWRRLEGRGTEPLAVRWKRLMTARDEIKAGSLYQNFIINRDLDSAYSELEGILIRQESPKLSREEGLAHCDRLLAEFDSAAWLDDLRRALV
jgi:guanylate kinase